MDANKEILIKAIEEEIERVEHHMYNILGLDREEVEELYRRIDIEVEKNIKKQFDNIAEMKR